MFWITTLLPTVGNIWNPFDSIEQCKTYCFKNGITAYTVGKWDYAGFTNVYSHGTELITWS
jgi:hypothetical protein